MTEAPVISAVVTVYNKRDALPRTLDSLRGQDGPPLEIICVDDASTDGSREWLLAEAERDSRLRVIEGAQNLGPAQRLNEGAQAARAPWLHLIDGDDLAPPGVQAAMLAALETAGLPLLYGRRREGDVPAPVPTPLPVTRITAPLAFSAGRPVTHMALMVRRDLFLNAGGADPRVFIQDQSLPLRLSAGCEAMLWTEETVCLAPPSPSDRLSTNRMQQNHDRCLAAINLLDDALTLPVDGERAVRALAVSALFKLEREAKSYRAGTALAYTAAKFGHPPSPAWLRRQKPFLAARPGIRRIAA